MVFAAAGIAGEGLRAKPIWSVFAEAQDAFENVHRRLDPASGSSELMATARRWKDSVEADLRDMIRRYPKSVAELETDEITTGIFAGIREDGTLAYVSVVLLYRNRSSGDHSPVIESKLTEIARTTNGWELHPYGDTAVWKEMQEGLTERSKLAIDQLTMLSKGTDHSVVESMAVRVAELTVAYSVDGKVGGDVDAVAVDITGFHWIRRKSTCA